MKPITDYFIPVKDKTKIQEDMLVVVLEGTSLKTNLPELRAGSELPIHFQFIDTKVSDGARVIRQRNEISIKFWDDPNACTLPKSCPRPDEDEGAVATTTFSAIAAAFISMLAF